MTNPKYRQLGFTFIELLSVIVIIGVITLIALSAYQGKRDETKTAAAWQEMKQLADAEKTVETYYGYFVPLSILNDVPGTQSDYPTVIEPDCIGRLPFSNNYLVIDPISGNTAKTIQEVLRNDASRWKGPFVDYQRQIALAPYDVQYSGLPLDPWRNPYLLLDWRYLSGSLAIDCAGNPSISYSSLTIDRFAIVSFGRDKIKNTVDDLIYNFR